MNGNSFQGDYNDPILLLAEQKNYSYPYDPKWNVVNFQTNSSIRINVYNNNTSPHVSCIVPFSISQANRRHSQCIYMATTFLSSTKGPVSGTAFPSTTLRILSVGTPRTWLLLAMLSFNLMRITQEHGRFTATSGGTCLKASS